LSSFPEIPATPAVSLSNVGSSGGKAITTGFGADEIGDSAKRASFFTRAFAALDRGSQQVVLVDDLSSNSSLPDVRGSLSPAIQSATGSAPEVINVLEGQDAHLSQISGKTVVWATGQSDYSETGVYFCNTKQRNLTANDQQTLIDFLDSGGKLILTGQDMFAGETYDLNSPTARPTRHDVLIPAGSATVAQGTYAPAAADPTLGNRGFGRCRIAKKVLRPPVGRWLKRKRNQIL
jgi:hypothetical protein